MYTIRLPFFLRLPLRNLIWRQPQREPVVYLTFDDGPIPEVTPQVLDILEREQVKATFFCVGDNVRKHPEVYKLLAERGHRIGQHTYHHLPAFRSKKVDYQHDIEKAECLIDSTLFRPPHGQLRPLQLWQLRSRFKVVLWDVLSADFDPEISPEQCLSNVMKYTRNGSVIVFHDSLKAEKNMLYALPRAIAFLKANGYHFATL